MRGSIVAIACLVAGATLTGCIADPSEANQARLNAAVARWGANGSPNYQFQLHWLCGECLPEWSHALQVRVQGGQVTEVLDLTAGIPIPKDSRALSIPELFSYLQSALDQHAYRLVVEYHSALGYPVSMAVDYNAAAVDDEGGFEVTNLVVLPQ